MIKRTTIKKEGLRIMTMQKRIEAFFNKLESTSKLIQKAKEECEESLKQLEDDRLDDVDESIMDNPKLDKIMERIDYFDSIRFDKISQLDDGELINYISTNYEYLLKNVSIYYNDYHQSILRNLDSCKTFLSTLEVKELNLSFNENTVGTLRNTISSSYDAIHNSLVDCAKEYFNMNKERENIEEESKKAVNSSSSVAKMIVKKSSIDGAGVYFYFLWAIIFAVSLIIVIVYACLHNSFGYTIAGYWALGSLILFLLQSSFNWVLENHIQKIENRIKTKTHLKMVEIDNYWRDFVNSKTELVKLHNELPSHIKKAIEIINTCAINKANIVQNLDWERQDIVDDIADESVEAYKGRIKDIKKKRDNRIRKLNKSLELDKVIYDSYNLLKNYYSVSNAQELNNLLNNYSINTEDDLNMAVSDLISKKEAEDKNCRLSFPIL